MLLEHNTYGIVKFLSLQGFEGGTASYLVWLNVQSERYC